MAKKDYSNLTKDQLLEVIEKLEGKKKYGLVWDEERVPEKVVTDCQDKLPVLTEVKGKEIITDENEPTHILIEGDNYHALSVLNYTHKGKVDLIYIDPPYNTGNNDFIYNDKYVDRNDTFRHSKWLNFMNKRLELAKELLKSTGAIFISIDDNEIAQLKLLCDGIFGEQNFVANCVRRRRKTQANLAKNIAPVHEYLLIYSKSISELNLNKLSYSEEFIKKGFANPDNDPRGVYQTGPLARPKNSSNREHTLTMPNGRTITAKWSCSEETFQKYIEEKRLVIPRGGDGMPRIKIFLSELQGQIANTWWDDVASNDDAAKEIENIFGTNAAFSFPKPTDLIRKVIELATNKNAIVLDFFAGSGTTGDAILQLNKNKNDNRKFILCTNNENQISENVTYQRIKRVIKGYETNKGDKYAGLGNNLKYFKTSFVANNRNKDQLKINITKRCTEMLCLKEGIFNLIKEVADYKIFQQGNRYLAVYYDFANASLDELKEEMNALKGEKILYCFTVDNHGLDKANFRGWKNIRLEPIPQKILDVYKRIFKN
ncbi:MAG: site-specific DNA-methyltransferase [Bacteroidia bacterium]|nr:site-specific DNA-methyltransferase [Bacteroidia bacterium]